MWATTLNIKQTANNIQLEHRGNDSVPSVELIPSSDDAKEDKKWKLS